MRVKTDGAPCERCGAVLAATADAQQLARHRTSRLCLTGPERLRLRSIGLAPVTEIQAAWLAKQRIGTFEADTDPQGPGLQTWAPAWCVPLLALRGDVPPLVLRGAVWRAAQFDAMAEALLTLARLGGSAAVREFIVNDPATLRTSLGLAAQTLASLGWTDA